MNIDKLGNGQIAVYIPMHSDSARDAHIKFKSFYNYGAEIMSEYRGMDMYMEWQISHDEIRQCLNSMLQDNIITQHDIQEVYNCIINHQQWYFYIVGQLQSRINYHYPYHLPGIPFPSYPNMYLMEHSFFKFPASSFYSERLYPLWIEVTLEKMGEGTLYLCCPLTILRNMQCEAMVLNRMAELNEWAYLILNDNSVKYSILETCSVAGRMSANEQQKMLQLLSSFLPQ